MQGIAYEISPWITPLNLYIAAAPVSCLAGGFCMFGGTLSSESSDSEVINASTDGGVTYSQVASPPDVSALDVLALSCFGTDGCGLLYEDQGNAQYLYFSESTDGGSTWSAPVAVSSAPISVAMSCTSATSCVVAEATVNKTAVYATSDAGTSWASGTWAGRIPNAKSPGVSLFGPMSCSTSVCMTFDESALFNASGAWDDLDRATL